MTLLAIEEDSKLDAWAPPARRRRWAYRVAAEVPYWDSRTYRALLTAIAYGNVISGPDLERLAARLREHFRRPVLVCGSGRSAMALALAAAGIGQGAEVVVPAFCCESVLHPIFAVGATPVFADVGPELMLTTDTVEAALTPRTRAVIVPHMFGNPAPIDAIADLTRHRGVLLLDDAAQALGGELRAQPLGTFGDAGIVSFGNGKVCFGTGGGALISADSDLIARARAITLERPRMTSTLGHVAGVLVWRRWRRHTLALLSALSGRGMIRRRRPSPWGAARNLDAAVALTLLNTLDTNVKHRRARVTLYAQRLAGLEGLRPVPHAAGSACLTQLVQVSGANPARTARRIINRLRADGLEALFSFTPLHLSTSYRELVVRPLPRADALNESLVELPAEPHIPIQEIERIAEAVRASVA
jgi:dTDP-4-amino-4,6-dideoxygalactose transaminase